MEKAYLTKLKEIRPDLGGDRQAFYAVQNAYVQAKEYVKFRGDRRGWIAKQMDEYLAVQEVIERLRQFGADVATDSLDWLQRSFGDFAQLTEVGDCRPSSQCAQRRRSARTIWSANTNGCSNCGNWTLTGSNVSDAAVRQLSVFRHLAELNLNHTPITWEGLHVVRVAAGVGNRFMRRHGSEVADSAAAGPSALRRNRKAAATARTVHPINVR